MEPSAITPPEPASDSNPRPEPLGRSVFLLLTGAVLGFFCAAALLGARASPPQALAREGGFSQRATPHELVQGGRGLPSLPPGHPPVEGYSLPDALDDQGESGCPYLDSEDDGTGEEAEQGAPERGLPGARGLRARAPAGADGPI